MNPLCGENDVRFGPRYFPIVHAYNKDLRSLAETVCLELEESVHQGVYAVVGGPNFESVAEINMLRTIGADVVGMSTVAEVLTAVHCGLDVLAISLVTNICVDTHDASGDLEEIDTVFNVIEKRKVTFLEIITKIIRKFKN